MWKNTLGNDILGVNVKDLQPVIKRLSLNGAITEEVKELTQQYRELVDKHKPGFSEEIKKTLEANPGGQEDDNPQQDRDSQATLPRENRKGERNGENNHNKKHRDSNPGRQEHNNPQQGKWKKNRDSQRENSQGERNGENNHNKKHRDSNPSGQEDDNRQQRKWKKNGDSQATLPRENSQGERSVENNHNKKHRDSNPGRQEHNNPQQGKWKKNRDSQRENRKGDRNGERRLTESNRTPHQNANTTENNLTSGKTTQSIQQVTRSEALNVLDMDQNSWSATVNINPITTLGENIKQKLQRNKKYIVPTLMVLLSLALWPSLNSWKKKNPKKVTTEQKDSIKRDSIKRDSESETIDKVSATGELSHFVKEGESMYSIVTNLKSSWTLSGISSVREDIIRVACEKGFIMKIKEGQTTKEKFDPRNLSPGDVIVIKIKEFEDLHRQ